MKRHPWLYSLLTIVAAWTLLHLTSQRHIVPSPIETGLYILQNLALLLSHVTSSLMRIIGAILASTVIGGVLGTLIARNQSAQRLLSPLLYTLHPVPKIAFLPIIMLWFGLGNLSKVILVALILLFQVTLTVRDSIRSIPESCYLSIRSLHATPLQVYRHVIFPASLPGFFTALRLSVGTSVSVLFFAENFATESGIGYFIMDSWLKLDYTAMFAGIISISLMGSALFVVLDYIEKRTCPWKHPKQDTQMLKVSS